MMLAIRDHPITKRRSRFRRNVDHRLLLGRSSEPRHTASDGEAQVEGKKGLATAVWSDDQREGGISKKALNQRAVCGGRLYRLEVFQSPCASAFLCLLLGDLTG